MTNIEENSLRYSKEIKEGLYEINENRLILEKYMTIITIASIPFLIIWWILSQKGQYIKLQGQSLSILIAIAIVILIPTVYLSIKYFNLYEKNMKIYKEKVMTLLIKSIDETFEYKYSDGIDIETFKSSSIFSKGIYEYNSEDLIRGIIGKTPLTFSKVHAESKPSSTKSKGEPQTTRHTIFKGIFFKADFNKNFKFLTVIRHDSMEEIIGNFAKTIQSVSTTFSDLKLVKLENTEFEDNFEVYSEDPVEARYILSPTMMEKILNIKKTLGYKIEISFLNSQIFIAIHIDENLFEPKLEKISTELSSLYKYYDIIKNVVEIVEQLDLNTRIWLKE